MTRNQISAAQLAVTAALISGDAGALYRIIAGLLDDGVPLDVILFDLLLPAEGRFGDRWQASDYLVSEEHAATATLETVISLLIGSLDQPAEGTRVVVAAAEGDDHSLPGRATAAFLLFLGFRTTYLGANVPANDLKEYLESDPPDALVLSCAMTNYLFGARSAIKASHALGVPVLAGGRGFGPKGQYALMLGADAWVASPRETAETLENWETDIAASEAQALDPSDDLLAALDARSSMGAGARELLWDLLGARNPRLANELDLLIGAVLASDLLDDTRIATDTLVWQAATLAAQGYDSAPLVAKAATQAMAGPQPRLANRLATATVAVHPH